MSSRAPLVFMAAMFLIAAAAAGHAQTFSLPGFGSTEKSGTSTASPKDGGLGDLLGQVRDLAGGPKHG